MTARPNRLIDEGSPYLRQHAHNPVDWFPWGPEALDRARREDKPILLSIGYSACHWCHVMERESFEDPAIAGLMNEHFVNIKVDREERPDLDAIYMNAVQMLTGSGGWPLTVFLTPSGDPFYGGTYFPPEDRYGRPGFPRVLAAIGQAYRESRDDVRRAAQQLLDGFRRLSTFEPSDAGLRPETVARGAEALLGHVDREHGGVGGAPKFPNPSVIGLFLRRYHATRRREFLDAAALTLTRMAEGGIYDQLGGGFHRYSVDAVWLVPHFEKMLYDNAQLVPLYLDAYLLTGDLLYRRVANETLEYLAREMTHPEGALYSTQDADSEGEEGKFYLWRDPELDALLSPEEAGLIRRHYGVTAEGNFAEPGHTERRSILYVARTVDQLAADLGRPAGEIERVLVRARAGLRAARDQRVWPALDDKILTSWNALAIRALVRAANVLGEPAHLHAAERIAAFIDRQLTRPDGRLRRTWKDGRARHDAILDDYAYLSAARLDLYGATGERSHLDAARRLADTLLERFADPGAGGFFLTAADHEVLVDRPKSAFDGALPSGNAIAVESLLRLSHLLEVDAYRVAAEKALRLFGQLMERQPFGTAALLGALADAVAGPTDVIVAGEADDERTRALLAAAHSLYVPGQSVYRVDPHAAESGPGPALLQGKHPLDGRPAAYVCRDSTCSPPVAEPAELRARLGA